MNDEKNPPSQTTDKLQNAPVGLVITTMVVALVFLFGTLAVGAYTLFLVFTEGPETALHYGFLRAWIPTGGMVIVSLLKQKTTGEREPLILFFCSAIALASLGNALLQ